MSTGKMAEKAENQAGKMRMAAIHYSATARRSMFKYLRSTRNMSTGKIAEKAENQTGKIAEKVDNQTGKMTEKAENQTGKMTEKAENQTGKMAEKAENQTWKMAEKTENQTGKMAEKAENQTGKMAEKAENQTGKMAEKAEIESEKMAEKAENEMGKLQEELDRIKKESQANQAITDREIRALHLRLYNRNGSGSGSGGSKMALARNGFVKFMIMYGCGNLYNYINDHLGGIFPESETITILKTLKTDVAELKVGQKEIMDELDTKPSGLWSWVFSWK